MRGVAITIGLVVVAGCGPNFDALFGPGVAPDASTPTPSVKDASDDAPPLPNDGGDGDADSDAGCGVTSCTPVVSCNLGACTYSCDGCGCACSAPCPAVPGSNSCTATCGAGTVCDAFCNAGAAGVSPGTCTFAARGAKRAAYTCGGNTGVCNATCDEGSDCTVSCNQLNTQCRLTCSDTAKCLLECNFSSGCTLDCESGAPQTCLNGSKTCNRACP